MQISKLGNIDILSGSCNISTVQDGRGAIFTWVPEHNIKEFNMVYFLPNKIRGNHNHPEFTEYFLVVSGSVVLETIDPISKEKINMHAGSGTCFRTPPNTPHVVYAITSAICISLLTKPWDDCEQPIIYEKVSNE